MGPSLRHRAPLKVHVVQGIVAKVVSRHGVLDCANPTRANNWGERQDGASHAETKWRQREACHQPGLNVGMEALSPWPDDIHGEEPAEVDKWGGN